MVIGCGLKCSKSFLLFFNLLFWLSGCLCIFVGMQMHLDPTKTHLFRLTATEDVSQDLLHCLAYFVVATGCVIIVVGFCGCCGSLYERRNVLITYFVFLFLLLCAELVVAVTTLVYREHFLTGLENRLMNRFKDGYGKDSIFTQAIEQAQFTYNCCGVFSDADYINTKWLNESATRSRINVPPTCCILANTDVSNAGSPITVVSRFFSGTVEEPWQHPQPKDETACQNSEMDKHNPARHEKGCLQDVVKWFKEDTTLLIGLGIGIAFLHMFGMIFSIILCRNLGDSLAQGH